MKALLIIFIVAAILGCNKKSNDKPVADNDKLADFLNRKLRNNDSADYHSVPAVISTESIGGNMERGMAFLYENEFAQKAENPAYSWQYFDSAYLALPEKLAFYTQHYGYAILIKKSLLDVPGDEATKKIKFYVNELVKTKYRGYGALYFALKKLAENSIHTSFVTEQLDAVLSYAVKDEAAKALLNEDLSKAPTHMRKQMGRSRFNGQFIAKLQALEKTVAGS